MGPLCGLSLRDSKTALPRNEMEMEIIMLSVFIVIFRKEWQSDVELFATLIAKPKMT